MSERQRRSLKSYAAWRVAIGYAVASAAWILITDVLLHYLPIASGSWFAVNTGKALFFVLVSSVILYFVLRRSRVVGDAVLADLDRRAADADQIAETLGATERGSRGVDLVEAHNALAESEARLRLIIGAAAEAIATCDERGMVLSWNREAQRVFGRTEEEAIGEELASMIVPAEEQARCREIVRTAGRDAPPARTDMTGMKADGTRFPIEVTVIAVEWGARNLHTAFIRDITDRVRAARESERIAAIVNASADAIFAVTRTGQITSWNLAAERMFGYSAEVVRGASLAMLFPEAATETVRWLSDSIARGIPIEAKALECERNADETFPVSLSVSPMRHDGTVTGAAVIVRDASVQLQSRDRVKDAEILAALGRLAAAVGHQFNNVLMGIQPFVDVLKRNELPAQAARAVDQIAKSVERGRRVTTEIQSFTRAGEPPTLRSVAAGPWLERLRPDLEAALGPAVTLAIDVRDDVMLAADPLKLRQVFLNLATSARDAMPEGGTCDITVCNAPGAPPHAPATEGKRGWVEIVVQDNGQGLDAESQRRIFEPLFAKHRGGSGLELATVEQIVRSHGGAIDVTSKPGSGTAFRIVLPRSREESEEEKHVSPATRRIGLPSRVLVVEDDTTVAVGLTQALSAYGVHVDVVHTGARVMAAVETFAPDVVVLDIMLPDANGFDVYRELAALYPALPVIFSTGHADEFDLETQEPLRLPHVALLRKPYPTDTLLATMERVMTARR